MKLCKECIFTWGLVIVLAVIGLLFAQESVAPIENSHQLVIDGHVLNIELADSIIEQKQGLSGRTDLSDDYGMLFVFDNYAERSFWMKDMLVPIDIVWVKDDKIVGYEDNVQPELDVADHELILYTSSEPGNYVLEVRAGLRAEKGWDEGSDLK